MSRIVCCVEYHVLEHVWLEEHVWFEPLWNNLLDFSIITYDIIV